jgi:hypothetical protein
MQRKLNSSATLAILGILTACSLVHPAMAQFTSQQPPLSSGAAIQQKPIPIEHLYWYFLVYQNHLDTKAAELATQGKNGDSVRNALQNKLGWSDADYAVLRGSASRLAVDANAIAAQTVAIRPGGQSVSNPAQLGALRTQRNAHLNNEVTTIRNLLPSDKVVAFESFLTRFFIQTGPSAHPVAASGQAISKGVQK